VVSAGPPSPRSKRKASGRKKSKRKKKPAWWRRVGAIILAAGALAGAVTAILGLWPDPDPADKVTISSAEVTPQPLSTFVATATIRPLDGGNLIDPFQALPDLQRTTTPRETSGSTDVTTGSTATSSTSSSGTTQSRSSSSSSSPTSSAATSSAVPELPPPAILDVPADVRDRFNEALHAAPDLRHVALPSEVLQAPADDPGDGTVLYAQRWAVDPNGDPLPVEEAARNLAAQLEQVRSVPNEGKRDPVGVRVTVDLELEGLRGVDVYLYWRLLSAGGSNPVPEDLAVATPAFMITPGTDLDSASVDAWVPLPEDPGPYELELLVTDGTDAAPLDSFRSEPFD
jgi:hypothetical protein